MARARARRELVGGDVFAELLGQLERNRAMWRDLRRRAEEQEEAARAAAAAAAAGVGPAS